MIASCLQELFTAVRELWKELWYLETVHTEAVSLLHARVLRTKQRSVSTHRHHGHLVSILNIFPPIVTLLAAGTKELIFNPNMVFAQKIPLDCVYRSTILTETNNVTTINTDKVDFGRDTDFFVHLLPCCHKLTTLVLEYNVTPEVLQAARQCPLRKLNITGRGTPQSLTVHKALAEVVLGIPHDSLNGTLDAYLRGKRVPLSPTWPNLTNLKTRAISTSRDFLTLVLVAHPNLEVLDNDMVLLACIVRLYIKIQNRLPSLHKLSLTYICGHINEILHLYPHYPKLQYVAMIIVAEIKKSLVHILRLACHLPNLAHLVLVFTDTTFLSLQLPKEDELQGSNQITTLTFEAIPPGYLEAWWLTALLKLLPCLKRLHLNTNRILCTEEGHTWVGVFTNLTNLQYFNDNKNLSMSFLSMFPNLYELTLTYPSNNSFPWKCLRELKDLRQLRIYADKLDNILDLCQVPRETPDGGPWILYVAARHVPEWVARKLQCSGWTWRPETDIVTCGL